MNRRFHRISTLLCALVPGCAPASSGGDSSGVTTTTVSSTTSNLSASATGAPGSMGETAASGVGPTTGATSGSGTRGLTGECQFFGCDDIPSDPRMCDVWAQDCPEGQKCAAIVSDGGISWNAVKCVDVTGTDEPGESCVVTDAFEGLDSCIKGAMCFYFDKDGVGYCVAQCTGSANAPVCESGGDCAIDGDGVLILCLLTCDPLLQDCPNPDLGCYPNVEFECWPDASGDEGQANDPCEFNDCDPGLMCAEAAQVGVGCSQGSTGCCTPFCEFPGGACPNPDQQCVQWFDPMTLPANDPQLGIGYCGVPG